MSQQSFCPICGTANPSSATQCRTCGAALSPGPASPARPLPPRQMQSRTPNQVRERPRRSGVQQGETQSVPLDQRRPSRAAGGGPAGQGIGEGGAVLEGTVVQITSQQEAPDIDWARLLFGLLLVADLVIIFGTFALSFFIFAIIMFAIAAVFGFGGCVGAIVGWFMNIIAWIFGPIIRVAVNLLRPRQDQLVPLLHVRVRESGSGLERDCRIKGQLRGSISERDRVRIWGRERNGIIYFRRGQNLRTGVDLTLPAQYSIWLLLGLVLLNIIGVIYILSNPGATTPTIYR